MGTFCHNATDLSFGAPSSFQLPCEMLQWLLLSVELDLVVYCERAGQMTRCRAFPALTLIPPHGLVIPRICMYRVVEN